MKTKRPAISGTMVRVDELQLKSKAKKQKGDVVPFKGWATTETVDRDDEVLEIGGFERAREKYMRAPAVALGHQFDASVAPNIGRMTLMEARPVQTEEGERMGVYCEGYIGSNSKAADIRTNLEEDIPQAFSVEFDPIEVRDPSEEDAAKFGAKTKRIVSDYELYRVGVVNLGSNRYTPIERKGVSGESVEKLVELRDTLARAVEILGLLAQEVEEEDDNEDDETDQNPEGEPPAPPEEEPDQESVEAADALLKELQGAASNK